jgi:hypothetical protein
LPAFLRLIRVAKVAALAADITTILYAVFIFGWQFVSLLRDGIWPALPLSTVLNKLEYNRGAIYATASASQSQRGYLTDVIESLLRVPVIVPLLLAAALITAFYVWLVHIEEEYSKN